MARPLHKLSSTKLDKIAKTPGMYGDGGGLWLCVSSKMAASWVFRFTLDGRAREMGLGSFADVPIGAARERAAAARRVRADGRDPIQERDRAATAARLAAARAITFQDAAERYIAAHRAGWRNETHAKQWPATLAAYAYPILGKLPVADVDVALVTKVLEPIWAKKPETASRLRGRIESVLDWAKARGFRDGENPARWRGHLDNLLPSRARVRRVRHHSALPYDALPAFMESLESQPGEAARALRFLVLTAARTGEVIGATGTEVDRAKGIWTIPAGRMKAGREHRVPLSVDALALLPNDLGSAPLFPATGNKTMSNMALLMLLRRMDRTDITAHGFRSTFRDWAAERTHYPAEMAEMALAHAVGNKVEAAYRRGDLFEKRRQMMVDWAAFCVGRNNG